MQRKISEISSFEVILCLSVVMIHILSDSVSLYAKGSFLYFLSFITSKVLTFVVPAFMITAGIKFAHKFENTQFSYFSFLKGRLTKIYLPYAIFTVIYYLYFTFHRHYFDFSFVSLADYIVHCSIAAPFYFIALIMQFYILSPLIMMLCRILPANLGIAAAAIITFLSMYFLQDFKYGDRIFLTYLLYWIIGCYIGMDFRSAISRLRRMNKLLVISGLFFVIAYLGVSYAEDIGLFASFLTVFLKVAFCLSSTFMWLSLMPKSVGFFAEELAPVTFYVFLIHCLVLSESQYLLDKWGVTTVPLRFVILFFATYIISLLVSVAYVKLKSLIVHTKEKSLW